MRTCVIFNPRAGTALTEGQLKELCCALDDPVFFPTEDRGDATRVAQDSAAKGFERIVAAGGDGTLNEVLNGLEGFFDQVLLGLLPLGTGNDFARSLNIPSKLEQAVNCLVTSEWRWIDILQYNGNQTRYFINASAGGFSGAVDERVTEEIKRAWGPFAYLKSALEALPDRINYHVHLHLDDQELIKTGAFNIVVANGQFVAGGRKIAPAAKVDDGLLDLVLVPVLPLPQLAAIVPQLLSGSHLDNEAVLFRQIRKLKVESWPAMPFNVDGELMDDCAATFEVLPRAVRFIVGENFAPSVSAG